nr:MAG TPA: minor structural protein [Caudoviricetes sp.]
MDVFRRQKFNEAMFAKNRTLAIRVGQYQSSDIKEASFDYGYIKGDTYKPGGTCAGSSKIVFASVITSFRKLDKITPEIGLLVDGTYEWVKMGEYFINDIEIDRNRNTTTLELMDGMFKLNREHVTDLTYPAEIRNVIKEICLKTGITLANETMGLASMNYRIDKVPKDKKMTFRDVLGLSAQMLGMSCFFNREGKLEVKELTDSGIVITADSYFMHGLTKSEIEYQIAGITCKKDKETLTVGLRTGRSLEVENVLMYQSALDNLYHNIKDIRYYPFSLNYQGHLLLEVGQWVTIKTNTGETFKSPVLSQSFNFKGGLRGRISADSKAGNDAQYSYAGTITKKIEQFNDFEAQIQNQIEEADKDFDNKVKKIKKDFDDQIELVNDKVKKENQKLSEEINRRFQEFNPSGFEEAKAKAEEALQKAGANADLVEEAKRIAADNARDLNAFKTSTQKEREKLSDELKRYSREESENKLTEIREVLASNYVSKRTYVEDAEGTRQRLEAITQDNKSKLAEYKKTVDGQFTKLSSQIADKVDRLDFQQVKETSQLYERVLGNTEQGLPDKISRLVMSNEIFQTEVGKYSTQGGPNMLRNSRADDGLKYWNGNPSKFKFLEHRFYMNGQKRMFLLENGAVVGSPWFIFKRNADYTLNLLAFDANTARVRITLRKYKKDPNSSEVIQTIFDKTGSPAFSSNEAFKRSFKFNTGDFDKGYLVFEYTGNTNGWSGMFMTELDFYEGSNDRKWQPAPEDSAEPIEAVRTQVTQLAGSWAVQNINSTGDLISGINLGANGHNRFVGKLTHITGDTLIDNAVIKSAMIDKLKTANFEAGSVTTTILGAEAVTADKVKFDTAFIQRLVSQQAFINELFAKQATITKIQSIDFTANHIKGGVLTSTNGKSVFDLNAGQIRMQGGPAGWRTSWDSNGLAFRGPNNDVWGAMGGDSGGGVGIYMRGDHAFNLTVNHSDSGNSQPYTALRVKYGEGTTLQFSPGGPSYNLLLLFNDIYRNIAQLHDVKTTSKNYSWSIYGPLK